jgi:hypothetical protein
VSGWDLGGVAGLGAFHGVNPAMGWLFAVAIGLQERSRRAVGVALLLIAAGHAASVGLTVVLIQETRLFASDSAIRLVGAALLVGFAAWKLLSSRSHLRWVGMRIKRWELVLWSFLMSSAHGAGLMLFPLVLAIHVHAGADYLFGGAGATLTAVAIHTAAMALVAGAIALAVYEVVGVGVLRGAWLNLDRVWAFGLIGGAAATLVMS